VALIVINVAVFVLQSVLAFYAPMRFSRFIGFLALDPRELAQGFLWQLITFQFLHASILHLLLNCLVIYMFGRALEEAMGRGPFLSLYFTSGICGGLLQAICGWLLPRHFGLGPVMGASAGAFGLVAAYAARYPEQPLTVLLAFIFPVSMRAKYLLAFGAGLAVFGMIVPNDNVAHAAHLGGLIGGLAFMYWRMHFPGRWLHWRLLRPPARPRRLVKAAAVKRPAWARSQPTATGEELPPDEFISQEVDPILDKILAHGLQSLTPRERQILETAWQKMAKR
jgi:membrane associated rhomboid family serine protease